MLREFCRVAEKYIGGDRGKRGAAGRGTIEVSLVIVLVQATHLSIK